VFHYQWTENFSIIGQLVFTIISSAFIFFNMAIERENESTPELLVDSSLPLGLLPVPSYKDPNLLPPLNDLEKPVIPTKKGLEASLPFIFPYPFSELPLGKRELLYDIGTIRQIPTFESGNRANRTIPKIPMERFASYARDTKTGRFSPTSAKANSEMIEGVYGSPMMGRSLGLKPELVSALGITQPFAVSSEKLQYINKPRLTMTIKGGGSNSEHSTWLIVPDPEGYVRFQSLKSEADVIHNLCYPDHPVEITDLYGKVRNYPTEQLWIPYRSVVAMMPLYKVGSGKEVENLLSVTNIPETGHLPFRFNSYIDGITTLPDSKSWDMPDALYTGIYINFGYDLTFNDYSRIGRNLEKADPDTRLATAERIIRDLCIDLGAHPMFFDMFSTEEFTNTSSEDFLYLFLERFYSREIEKNWLETKIEQQYGLETRLDNNENRAPGKGRKDFEGDRVTGNPNPKDWGIFKKAGKHTPFENVFHYRMSFDNEFITSLMGNLLDPIRIEEAVTKGILVRSSGNSLAEIGISDAGVPMVTEVLEDLRIKLQKKGIKR